MGDCLSSQSKIEGSPVNTDHFEIERVVGVGGFGKVNCVTKLYGADSMTRYAMKTLWKKEAFKTKSSEDMLFNEREILEKLHHPRLVNMLYAFQDPYRCYLVLDLALGGDLAYQQRQQPGGVFDENQAIFYIGQLFQALEYMHSLSILHRDVKPDNLVLEASGHVKLTDFGISKYLDKERRCAARSGTGAYMAPEIKGKDSHGVAADVYAMGITLFVFLTGYLPIPKSDMSTRKKRRNSRIGKIGQRPQDPASVEDNKADHNVKGIISENPRVQYSTTAEIIQHGIQELKSAGKYSEACLDFLKCITMENENDRLQVTIGDTISGKAEHEKYILQIGSRDIVEHSGHNADLGVHDRIRQHRWFARTSGSTGTPYLDRLCQMEIDPPFLPDTTKANCDTGHTDATDTLLGEGILVKPDISSAQVQRLETYDYKTAPVDPDLDIGDAR